MDKEPKKSSAWSNLIFPLLWVVAFAAIGISLAFNGRTESAFSQDENRMLQGLPKLTFGSMLHGDFSGQFENYLLDNFVFRKQFTTVSTDLQGMLSLADLNDTLLAEGDHKDELSADISTLPPLPDDTDTPAPVETPSCTLSGPVQSPDSSGIPSTQPAQTAPSATPKPVYPATLSLAYTNTGGKKVTLEAYRASNVEYSAKILNAYAGCLPEGGQLCFVMVPTSSMMSKYIANGAPNSLTSNMEDCLRANVSPNVNIFSVPELLSSHIASGEYLYFRSDMHWTPFGAHYIYEAMMQKLGMTPVPYSSYSIQQETPFLGTYYRDNHSAAMARNPDTIDIVQPYGEAELRYITAPGKYTTLPMLNLNAPASDRYSMYLSGAEHGLCCIQTNAGTGKKALVVRDSFGLCFTPFLVPHYDEIYIADPRYFSRKAAGGGVKQLIAQYGIQDCFMIVWDEHSYNNEFLQSMTMKILN